MNANRLETTCVFLGGGRQRWATAPRRGARQHENHVRKDTRNEKEGTQMDHIQDIELHDLETIEENLSVETTPQAEAQMASWSSRLVASWSSRPAASWSSKRRLGEPGARERASVKSRGGPGRERRPGHSPENGSTRVNCQ